MYLRSVFSCVYCDAVMYGNVPGVKRHIMPDDLPERESISGAEINLTVCAVNTGVLC